MRQTGPPGQASTLASLRDQSATLPPVSPFNVAIARGQLAHARRTICQAPAVTTRLLPAYLSHPRYLLLLPILPPSARRPRATSSALQTPSRHPSCHRPLAVPQYPTASLALQAPFKCDPLAPVSSQSCEIWLSETPAHRSSAILRNLTPFGTLVI
jgi:hypothetical protein